MKKCMNIMINDLQGITGLNGPTASGITLIDSLTGYASGGVNII